MSTLPETLRQRLTTDLATRGLLPRGAPVLVALSGGRDSVALLSLLTALQPWGGWRLYALHCDHQLRGAAAAQSDRELCAELCARLRVPLTVETLQVVERIESGVSLETAAREVRLAALRRHALAQAIPVIATAHHADDRVETLLFRILRGTGLRGLTGIDWRREEPLADPPPGLGFSSLQFHRPLLGIWREELTEYARGLGLRWNDDPTNDSDAHTRNRIRRHLLPKLAQDYNQEVRRHLWNLAEDAADWLAVTPDPTAPDPAPATGPAAAWATPGIPSTAEPPRSVSADAAIVDAAFRVLDDLDAADRAAPVAGAAATASVEPGDDWPWPQLPLVIDGATLLGLSRPRAIQALQTLLETARRRTGFSGAPTRAHYHTLYQMLTAQTAPAALSLPGGWHVRRTGTPPHVRLTVNRP